MSEYAGGSKFESWWDWDIWFGSIILMAASMRLLLLPHLDKYRSCTYPVFTIYSTEWSKTTLNTGGVGGTGVANIFARRRSFLLSPWQ